jgi:hypothetical protein
MLLVSRRTASLIHSHNQEEAMRLTCLGLSGALLALASCDTDVVRFEPQSAPRGEEAGLHVVLEHFSKETATADIWLEVTNMTASPIALKAPPGSTLWAKAGAGDQEALVIAERWSPRAEPDDQDDTAYDKVLGDPYILRAGAKRELELLCRLARPLATSHEPWKLTLFIAGRSSIELPIADPQVASTQLPQHQ